MTCYRGITGHVFDVCTIYDYCTLFKSDKYNNQNNNQIDQIYPFFYEEDIEQEIDSRFSNDDDPENPLYFLLNIISTSNRNREIFDLILFWADVVWQFCLGVTGRLDNCDGHDHQDPS